MQTPISPWLLAVIKNSQSSSSKSLASPFHIDQEPSLEDDPRFKPIVDGIHFTLKFILSYHVVILAFLLLFTTIHWTSKLRRWRRSRRQRKPLKAWARAPRGNISRDRTIVQVASPPPMKSIHDERSSLLGRKRHRPRRLRPGSRLKSFLMYQPEPMPFIGKVLPDNGTSLLVLVFIALNAFYFFFFSPMKLSMAFVWADRASALFVANLPLLYLLSAKNQPIKWLTGYSYERLNILHRRLGEVLCLLALVHSGGMFIVWYTILRPAGWTIVRFLTEKIILLGIVAFVVYELLYATSLGSFRKRWYELFLVLHVGLQTVALVLVFFHHPRSRVYVGIALAIFLVDRLFYRLALKTRQFRAELTIMQDQQTVMVSANWQILNSSVLALKLRQSIKAGWKPTDHVFLTVPALAPRHFVQAHPFTIASGAPHEPRSHAWLNLLVRSHDGFSKDLLEYAKTHQSANVYLDGPYGSQHALDLLEDSNAAILVAGGSGIAVCFPLIEALFAKRNQEGSISNLEDGSAYIQRPKKKIILVWVVREQSQFRWLGASTLTEIEGLGAEVHLLPPTKTDGRPDMAKYVQNIIDKHVDRDRATRIGVVCSGPDGMNRDVRNSCAALVRQGRKIKVAVEKFGW